MSEFYEEPEVDVHVGTDAEPVAEPEQATLPRSWSKHIHHSGHTYFVDDNTGESQWEKPDDFEDDESPAKPVDVHNGEDLFQNNYDDEYTDANTAAYTEETLPEKETADSTAEYEAQVDHSPAVSTVVEQEADHHEERYCPNSSYISLS